MITEAAPNKLTKWFIEQQRYSELHRDQHECVAGAWASAESVVLCRKLEVLAEKKQVFLDRLEANHPDEYRYGYIAGVASVIEDIEKLLQEMPDD